MRKFLKPALIVLGTIGAPVIATAPAMAAVDFSVSLGNAAYGYSDGYWDRDHRWHAWRNRDEARYFRDHYGEHYVDARHDRDRRDRLQGWRNDRWWDERR
jgi:hypothetical protein